MSDARHTLSQDMLKELLAEAAGGGAAGAAGAGGDRCEPFDWSQPTHYSRRQMDHLRALFKVCCQAASERLSKEFGDAVSVEIARFDQRHFTTFCAKAAQDEAFLFLLSGDKGQSDGAFVVPPALGHAWIERLLGATEPGEQPPKRLSALDQSLLVTVAGWVVEAVCGRLAAESVPGYRLVERLHTPVPGARERADDEILAIEMAMESPAAKGAMTIAFPVAALDGLCGGAVDDEEHVSRPESDPEADRQRLLGTLALIPIELAVRLGTSELTLDEIIHLEPGDVVVLDRRTDDEMEVEIGGALTFMGRAGRSSCNHALQITRAQRAP